MIIASMIIKVVPEAAEDVVLELKKIPNVSTHGIYKEENIVVVVETEREAQLEDFTRFIMGEFDGIIGTFPTFVGSEEALEQASE